MVKNMKILDDDTACITDDDGERILIIHEELGTIAELEGDIEDVEE